MPGVGYRPNVTHGNRSWRVELISDVEYPVCDRPNGTVIGVKYLGDRGWTLEGTAEYPSPYNDWTPGRRTVWWRIRWDDGTIGWSPDSYFENPPYSLYLTDIYLGKTGETRSFSRNLSVSHSSIDFGDIPVGELRTASVTITNFSSSTGNVSGTISLSGHSDFRVTSGGGSFSLQPGESRTVTIEFRPSSAGSRSATLRIEHNANSPSSPINVPISGSGRANTYRLRVSVSPSSGGQIRVNGGSWTTSYNEQLPADTPVTIEARANSGWRFDRWSGVPNGVPERQSRINFTLDQPMNITANFVADSRILRVFCNDNNNVPCERIDFGRVRVGQSRTESLVITNLENSTGPIVISVRRSGDRDFKIIGGGSGTSITVSPGSSYTLAIEFQPSRTGNRSAVLEIAHDANNPESPVSIQLFGEGTNDNNSHRLNLTLPIKLNNANLRAQTYCSNGVPPGEHGSTWDKMRRVVDLYPLPINEDLGLEGKCGDTDVPGYRDEAKKYVVRAAHDGNVVCVRSSQCDGNSYKYVIIRNTELGIDTIYVHQNTNTNLSNGVSVRAGQPIGMVDMQGCARLPHLHFAIIDINKILYYIENEINNDLKRKLQDYYTNPCAINKLREYLQERPQHIDIILPLDTGEVTFDGVTLFSGTPCVGSPGRCEIVAYRHMGIQGAPPEVDIEVNASPNRVTRGDTVLISGTVTPASQRRITVLVRSPNPEQDILDYEIETEADGTFSFPFQVPNDAPVGTWDVIVYVHELNGNDDLSSDPVEFEVVGSTNLPPQTPQILAPENEAITSPTPTFILKATDPDGNNLKFRIELRRGENDTPMRFEPPTDVPSGSEFHFSPSVNLSESQWQLRARAIDTNNAESEWSEWRTFTVNSSIPTRLQGFNTFGYILQSTRSALEELFEGTIAIWRWNPESGTYENVTSLTPGSAYWYQASSEVRVRFTGTLMPPSTPIPLRRGWNLIPAFASMLWNIDAIQVRRGTETKTLREAQRAGWVEDYLWAWKPSGSYQLVYDSNVVPNVQSNIEAWRGYWLYAHTDCELVLSSGSRAVTRSVPAQARGWSLVVSAETGSDSSEVVLGVSSSRALAVERPPDPPTGKPAVRLFLKRGETELATDIRRSAAREKWELEVEVDPHPEGREVTLRWRNTSLLPRSVHLVLIDQQTGTRRYLRSTASYTFRAEPSGGRYRFQVELIPTSQLLRITNVSVQSSRGGQHTLTFSLTSEAQVEIEVLGLNGQAVRTLMTGTSRSAGTHSVVWDGRNQAGVALPPGMYQLTISAMSSDGQVARVAVPVVVGR